MRVRKIAKQLKRWYKESSWDDFNDEPIWGYKMGMVDDKISHIMRMTRKHYFGLLSTYPKHSEMWKLFTHKASSPTLYDEILEFWKINWQ